MDEQEIDTPEETDDEAEYAFEGYRIAFNRRVALTPPAGAAPSGG